MAPARRRQLAYIARILAIAVLYFVTADFALRLHELAGVAYVIWAPSGIGFAIVLLYGLRWLPGVALGTFASVVLRHHVAAASVVTVTECLEVVLGYYLLRKVFGFRPQLERVRDVVAFAGVDLAMSLLGATIGTYLLLAIDFVGADRFVSLWSTWWWINLSGDLIVCPAVLTWASRSAVPAVDPMHRERRTIEILALTVSGLLLCALMLDRRLPAWLPASHAPYYLLPLLLWAGVRFGPRGAATASLLVSMSALAADALGVGPFQIRADLQAFVSLSSVTTLMLSALVQERVRAVERTGAIQRGALDGIITIDEHGRIVELNPAAEQLFAVRAAETIGKDLASVAIPPRLRGHYYQGLSTYAATGESEIVGSRYRTTGWRADDRREFPVEIAVTRAPIEDKLLLTGFIRDVSAEYAAETARREARLELERIVEQRTGELQKSLREKDVLLREVHHRVKNNLQVISSLLNLQVAAERSDATRRRLLDNQNRIQAMALVHQLLYQSIELAQVDFGDYLRQLVMRLAGAAGTEAIEMSTNIRVDLVPLDIDRAILCGMIVNELVGNAVAHAFPERRAGHISVTLERKRESLVITVADDGVGLPADIRIEDATTFGLQIVRTLSSQLDATLTRLPAPGTAIRIVFPAPRNHVTR